MVNNFVQIRQFKYVKFKKKCELTSLTIGKPNFDWDKNGCTMDFSV